MTSTNQRITFPGSQGVDLAARLERPAGTPRGFVLFAHCFSCSKDVLTAVRLSAALTERGFALLRFDFTGLGNSHGDFANTNFSSNTEDLLRAAQYLRQNHGGPDLLIGHSLGGAAVLAVAGEIPEVKAIATLAAPSDPGHVSHLFAQKIDEISARGEAEVDLAGRKFTIRKQFLDDIQNQNLLEKVRQIRKPLLIYHSPIDRLVSIDHAAQIYSAARHPKSFISLDDADHMIARAEDADFVAATLTAWAARYLPARPAAASEGLVTVSENPASPFAQTVRSGVHHLIADEPESVGGKDLGPGPYDLLLASLGSCTAMTIRMYAARKKIPLEHIEVTLTHDKIHAADCAGCETEQGRVDQITRTVTLHGPLSDEQRAKLLEIADKCPVHRTLHSEISVVTLSG